MRWHDAELAAEARLEFERRLTAYDIAVRDGSMTPQGARDRRDKMLAIVMRLEQLAESADARAVLDPQDHGLPDGGSSRCRVCGSYTVKYGG